MTISRCLSQMLVIGAVAGVVACRDEPQPMTDLDNDRPGVADSARDAGDRAADAARDAGESAADAARDAGDRVGAAIEATDVRLALSMDSDIDADDLDVDVDHTARVVTLKGFVPTADQRTRAEQVARDRADGYRVDNQLEVRATP